MSETNESERYKAGMAVRRQVLGDAHVDRATAQMTEFDADFQTFITEGAWGSVWNGRDESVPWVAALSRITDRREGDTPRYRTGAWRKAFPARGFEFIGDRHVRNHHIGSAEQVVLKRTMSVSFIAGLPADERHEVEREVRDLIDRTPELAGGLEVAFPYVTRMFAYRAI